MRRRSLRVGLLATLVACADVLGIENRPLREDGTVSPPLEDARGDGDVRDDIPDAPQDVGTDSGSDGGADAACDRLVQQACSADCPRDFCDDFDGDGRVVADRWMPPAMFTNPVLAGTSSAAFGTVAKSAPRSLFLTTSSVSAVSYSIVGHALPFRPRHEGRAFDGVRFACDFRIDALTFLAPGGPVPNAGNAAMLGVLPPDLSSNPHGIAVVLGGSSLYLVVADDFFGGSGSKVTSIVSPNRGTSFFQRDWLQLELFVGDRDRAVMLGYTACGTSSVTPGLVAAAALGGKTLGDACVNVPSLFGPANWAENPVLIAGSILFAKGNAAFRFDNVVADFYER